MFADFISNPTWVRGYEMSHLENVHKTHNPLWTVVENLTQDFHKEIHNPEALTVKFVRFGHLNNLNKINYRQPRETGKV